MSRYSPRDPGHTVVPTVFDALNQLFDRGREAVARKRERELEDEELGYVRGERDRQGARDDLVDYQEGIREGRAPQRRGMAPERPSVFQDVGIGRAPAQPKPLREGLEELISSGRPKSPKLVAMAGAFVPGIGFAPRNLFDRDLPGRGPVALDGPPARQGALGLADRRPVEHDPRFVQLTGDRYLDTTATPAAREAKATREEQARLTRILGALRSGGRDPELLAEAVRAGVPWSELKEPEAGEEPPFDEEMLREAGIPERTIRAALRDPALARQLMTTYNRPPTAGRDPYGGRTRDQFLQDLEDTERTRRRVAEEFDDRGGDPRLAERRAAIIKALESGGRPGAPLNELEQNAVDALASGVDQETILLRAEELVEAGELDEDDLVQLERYLEPLRYRR